MMKPSLLRATGIVTAALVVTGFAPSLPASADTASTAAIAAGAALIVGGLIYDSQNRPYYNRGGRRVYVSERDAQDYRRQGGRYRDNHGQWHQDHGDHGDHGNHGGH